MSKEVVSFSYGGSHLVIQGRQLVRWLTEGRADKGGLCLQVTLLSHWIKPPLKLPAPRDFSVLRCNTFPSWLKLLWVGFSGASQVALVGKQSVCRRHKRHRLHPWVRKKPWRRKWQPTPVFLPGKSHGQRSLVGYSPQGREELDMTKYTHTHTLTHTHTHTHTGVGFSNLKFRGL